MWGRTRYIDIETGEEMSAREVKKHIIKIERKEVSQNGGYKVETKYITIKGYQTELFT